MLDKDAQPLGKAFERCGPLAQHADGDADVTQQLTLRCVGEARLPRKLTHLANVVQDGRRHQQIRIDLLRILRSDAPAQAQQEHHMLQQAADPGMVQHLSGGRRTEGRRKLRIVEEAANQALQVGVREVVHEPE